MTVCPNCTVEFLPRRGQKRFCSPVCYQASRIPADRPCSHCGKPLPADNLTYCSRACRQAVEGVSPHPCPACGKPTNNLRKFCSVKCGASARLRASNTCKHCNVEFKRVRNRTFCSTACWLAHKQSERGDCLVCQKPLLAGQKTTCSLSCSAAFGNMGREHAPPPQEKIDAVASLRSEGVGTKEIAKRLGIGRWTVDRIISTNKIPLTIIARQPTPKPPRIRVQKAPRPPTVRAPKLTPTVMRCYEPRKQPAYAPSKPKAPPRPREDKRVSVPLREVFRLASDYQINRGRYGDDWEKLTAAISKAMQREDPSYPGIALMPSRFVGQSQITSKVWV